MKHLWQAFWAWYERTYTLNVSIALGLFLLQIIHLVWLSGEVAWAHIFGSPLFTFSGIWSVIILLVDYTEIPALISVSAIYVNELRKGWDWKSAMYLLFLNSQWLHIFWITDEYVVDAFTGEPSATILPLWLAWVAIAIDYLELPVMYDTTKRFLAALRQRDLEAVKEAFEED